MVKNSLMPCFILFSVMYVVVVNTGCAKTINDNSSMLPGNDTSSNNKPALKGKLVFHQYDSYGDAAKMYLYDFSSNILINISKNWGIYNPINAHFNKDGSAIVFMGEKVLNGKWDIYIWQVNSTAMPVNLTNNDGCRDEDPKFSPDGTHICFKQTPPGEQGNIKIMDLMGKITNSVSSNSFESSMPYYTTDGKSLVYARGAGPGSDIYLINTDGGDDHAICNEKNIQEYYPITMNDSAFLYTRWNNSNNYHDQVYLGYFKNSKTIRLLFNTSNADYSDAFPCDDNNIILSCDKSGGRGAYDLYVADINTGEMWSLNSYNPGINSSKNELGACFSQ